MKFVLSLAEQGFGSLLTFGVNLWLIRHGEAQSYGVYVFWLSVAWVLGTAQGTLVIAHLFRLPPAREHAAERRQPERLFLTVSLVLTVIAALCAVLGNLMLAWMGSSLFVASSSLFIAAFLFFQYVRAFTFSRQRTFLAACLSGGILLSLAILLVVDFGLGHDPSAERVLTLAAVAYGGVSLLVLLMLLGRMRPMLDLSELRRHAHLLSGSAWLLLGAGSGEVTNRLYSFAVVGRFGTEELAALSAVQVVIRPAWMLSAAWSSIGFPQLSARRVNRDWRGFARSMLLGAAAPTLGSLVWTLIVILGWPFVSGVLYHGRYPDVGLLPYLWGVNVMAGSVSVALNTALLSLGEYKRLAGIDLCGGLMTIAVMIVVVTHLNYPFSIVATVLGQGTQIVLMMLLVQQRLRALLRADAQAGAAGDAGRG